MGVAVVAAAAASSQHLWLLAVPLWAVAAGLYLVFRSRRPAVPSEPLGLIAPLDGRVLRADSVEDPWLKRRALRLRIGARFPGVSVVRSPAEGKILGYWVAAEPFDAAAGCVEPEPGDSPNCYAIGMETDMGDEVGFVLSSVRPISRFRLDISPGERAGQGEEAGFVYFATYVDLLMPRYTRIDVEVGDAVVAGESVVGTLVRD